MAAPNENQFWKLRSSHGRNPIFKTPDDLWNAAVEYFEATDKRVWEKQEFHGKDPIKCIVESKPPYTLSGLCIFLDIAPKTWNNYQHKEDFLQIVTRIEQIIYTQKFEGASVGAYNSNIIARDLGLRDVKDVNLDAQRKNIQDLFPDELNGEEDKS